MSLFLVFDFQSDIIEINGVTVSHSRKVESYRLEELAIFFLGVAGANRCLYLHRRPFCGIVNVAEQLIVVVVARCPVSLCLKRAGLFTFYFKGHLYQLARGYHLVSIDKELAIPRCQRSLAVRRNLVTRLVSLLLGTYNYPCAVVIGVGGVFHDFGKALELADFCVATVILLTSGRVEFHPSAPVVAPEARPRRILLSFHTSVDYEISPSLLCEGTGTDEQQRCHNSKDFLHNESLFNG